MVVNSVTQRSQAPPAPILDLFDEVWCNDIEDLYILYIDVLICIAKNHATNLGIQLTPLSIDGVYVYNSFCIVRQCIVEEISGFRRCLKYILDKNERRYHTFTLSCKCLQTMKKNVVNRGESKNLCLKKIFNGCQTDVKYYLYCARSFQLV